MGTTPTGQAPGDALPPKDGQALISGPGKARSSRDVPVKVIGKAARVLNVFCQEGAELPLRQIALAAGIELSTASRLVASLARVGLLRYDPIQRLYSPGLLILELSRVVLNRFSFRELAHRELISLSMETGWECYLAVADEPDDRYIIAIDAVSTRRPEASMVGERRPMHSTASGKVLMAYRDRRFVGTRLEARTAFTHTQGDELLRELEEVRRNGFAIGRQEEQLGYSSVAAPIFDKDGAIVAALAVGVTHGDTPPDMAPLVSSAIEKARGITAAIRLIDSASSATGSAEAGAL